MILVTTSHIFCDHRNGYDGGGKRIVITIIIIIITITITTIFITTTTTIY